MMFLALALWGCRHVPLASPGAQCAQAERHLVQTEDGATVHLHRHPADGPPILVVHGISANHRSWDLTEDRSLAVALQAQGYDAWLLDLRGHGDAHQDADGHEQRAGWSMADYGRYDLPAAIQHIQAQTGYDQLGYVGHSMGGMVAVTYQAQYGDSAFAAMVIVATPVDFQTPDPLLKMMHRAIRLTPMVRVVPSPAVARASTRLHNLPLHADELLWSESNLSRTARDAMLSTVVSPMPRSELRAVPQFLHDGQYPETEALSTLSVPIRVIAGRADRIAPVDRVYPYYSTAGSTEKDFILAARTNGFAHDYGHLDLVVGDDAAEEIYPHIISWFEDRW